MLRKRTTGPGVPGSTARPRRPVNRQGFPEWRMTRSRLARAVIELARERRRLAHVPTMAQLRMMAGFEGRAPSTYGSIRRSTGCRSACRWTSRTAPTGCASPHAGGESVVLPNGCGFVLD